MSDNTPQFIGFEYNEIIIPQRFKAIVEEGYEHFGWCLEASTFMSTHHNKIALKFKRDRKIKNKRELLKLQQQFDAIITELNHLERRKVFKASAVAYAIGCAACVVFALCLLASVALHNLILTGLLLMLSLVGFSIPYIVFMKMKQEKTLEVNPIIESRYDSLYDLSKQANVYL